VREKEMAMSRARLPLLAALWLTLIPSPEAGATTIDFDSLQHGEAVDTQFSSSLGVTISAINVGGGPDVAIAFDSLLTGTRDPDLEGPAWSRGNLAPSTSLGRLLIVAENVRDENDDGLVDDPDDEGSRPAGSIFFDFESFGEFIEGESSFFVPDVVYGNNSANRIAPITAADLGLIQFSKVELNLGGSSAVDNIRFEPIPEPASLVLLGAALALTSLTRLLPRYSGR
jgi:hypothetical protein